MKNKTRLQVKMPEGGEWLWVAGWIHTKGELFTTTSKRKAVPPKTFWWFDSLAAVQHSFPHLQFRLAESREAA